MGYLFSILDGSIRMDQRMWMQKHYLEQAIWWTYWRRKCRIPDRQHSGRTQDHIHYRPGNSYEIAMKDKKLQETDEVWKEVIKWVLDGKVSKLLEVRGKVQEVQTLRQLFNPLLFVMYNAVLCYNRHTDPARPYDALHICIPEMKLKISKSVMRVWPLDIKGLTEIRHIPETFFVLSTWKSEDRWNIVTRDGKVFIFFNNRFVMKTMTKNWKQKDRFKTYCFF